MKIIVSPEYPHLEEELQTLPRWFEHRGEIVHDGRNTIRNIVIRGKAITIKRFKRAHFFQKIVYTFFRPSKAARAFSYAKRFRAKGIPTPLGIAYVEEKEHGLFTTGYFLCETCPDPTVRQALEGKPDFDRELAKDLMAFIAQMHEQGILHGDLNLGNFLYRKKRQEDGYSFTVIDINRSRFLPQSAPPRQCLHDLRTMTHHRELFDFLVELYAEIRHWDPSWAKRLCQKFLRELETRNKRKRFFKTIFR